MNPYAPPVVLTPVLRPAAWLYGLAAAWRNRRYETGARTTEQLAHPVLAVGNLTVGGTGKTPVTAHLAAEFQRRGWRPAILSCGYREAGRTRRGGRGGVRRHDHPPRSRGGKADEPVLLARRLPGVPVLCHRRRAVAGHWAEANLSVNLFILDDGFQHRALHRDCNLLLLDGAAPLGNGRPLPAGPLREHARGMSRADLILLTRCVVPVDTPPPAAARHAPGVPVFSSDFIPVGLSDPNEQPLGGIDGCVISGQWPSAAWPAPSRFSGCWNRPGSRSCAPGLRRPSGVRFGRPRTDCRGPAGANRPTCCSPRRRIS